VENIKGAEVIRSYLFILALILAACSREEARAVSDRQDASAAGNFIPEARAAPADAARAVKHEERTNSFHFAYAYPAAAAAIPALKAWLDAESNKLRAALADYAKENGASSAKEAKAKEGSDSYFAFEVTKEWTVITELPGWLSLFGHHYGDSGGVHGNWCSSALLWDKVASRARKPLALFRSKAAFNAALGSAYCAALDAERSKRRNGNFNRTSGDQFDSCLDPSKVTILLGSTDNVRFTRIGLMADPYMAGPYAEGDYEITLPVTPAVIAAVRPQYRGAFAVGR